MESLSLAHVRKSLPWLTRGTARYSSRVRIAEAGTNRTHRPARFEPPWRVRATSMVRTNPGSRMGARRAPAPSSPQLCSGQKPTPRPRPIILRTTDGLSLSKAIVGRNPSLAHCDRQRLLMLREPASIMKPLFCIWASEIASSRPLAKASLAAMSRSSPPGLSPFPGLSRKPASAPRLRRRSLWVRRA